MIRSNCRKRYWKKQRSSMKNRKRLWHNLVKLRNEMRKEELMDAVIKSKRSYSEIMAFIKGMPADED